MSLENISACRASNRIAQFEQFTVDFAVAPTTVLLGQAEDERFEISSDRRATTGSLESEGPFATDKFTMPLEQRVWLEQQHSFS